MTNIYVLSISVNSKFKECHRTLSKSPMTYNNHISIKEYTLFINSPNIIIFSKCSYQYVGIVKFPLNEPGHEAPVYADGTALYETEF